MSRTVALWLLVAILAATWGLHETDTAGNLFGLTAPGDSWAKANLGFDPSNVDMGATASEIRQVIDRDILIFDWAAIATLLRPAAPKTEAGQP